MKRHFIITLCATLATSAGFGYAKNPESPTAESDMAALNNTFGATSQLIPDNKLNGEWTFYTLYGDKVTGEEPAYINIVNSEGRFYGCNGCNIINGTIMSAEEGEIAFKNVLSTRKYCQDAPFEYKINIALDAVKGYKIQQHSHEYYLDLTDSRGHVIIVLRHHNMDFMNGAWHVTAINGVPNRIEGVNLVIDITEGHIHGNTGCNLLNGDVSVDPDRGNSIQFNNIGSTRMMCPDMSTETALLVALEEAETAYADGNDAASVYNAHGKQVLTLKRISEAELRDNE